MMPRMTVERNAQLRKSEEGAFSPMVGMRVRKQHGVDMLPRQFGALESCSQRARAKAAIDEDAEGAGLNQARIPLAAAGENCETQRHPCVLVAGVSISGILVSAPSEPEDSVHS